MSTNNSPNSTSGFFVGRNSRSLFVENYNNDQSVQDIYTHKKELLGKNIVSITKNDLNDISVSVHDFLNTHELSTETFSLNGYSESDQINIGGFLNNQKRLLPISFVVVLFLYLSYFALFITNTVNKEQGFLKFHD